MAEPAHTKTLILFAHPALERSRINLGLLAAAKALPGGSVRDLYELYPDFAVDVAAEQRALLDHDLIVLQFPFYWYSTPALMKEWLDLVLEHGFAYGARGRALEGKTLACAISTGGGRGAYSAGGHNRFSFEDFLRPLEQTAHLCRMRWAEPFAVHGAAVCTEVHLENEIGRYREFLDREAIATPPAANPAAGGAVGADGAG